MANQVGVLLERSLFPISNGTKTEGSFLHGSSALYLWILLNQFISDEDRQVMVIRSGFPLMIA